MTLDVATCEQLAFGRLQLLEADHSAEWRNEPIRLTATQFKVLRFLASSARPVTFREIYSQYRPVGFHAGNGEEGINQNARTQIKRLRQAFGAVDRNFDRIETIEGVGYRWVPDSERPETFGGCTI